MKPILFLLALTALAACTKQQTEASGNKTLEGTWVRTEVYVSPGNGGNWQPAQDNPAVLATFDADGSFSSNHNYYRQFNRYERTGDTLRLTGADARWVAGGLFQNGTLSLWYACICGCGDRFVKSSGGAGPRR